MQALVKTRPGPGLELAEVPVPRPGPGEVLVRVAVAAVCGSDVARYRWSRNYEAGAAKDMTRDLPRILGHEFSGTVETGADGVPDGARVAIRNILGCGRCRSCVVGYASTCTKRRTIGVHTDGGYAEYAVVPAANCTVLDDGFDLHLAAALQPFAIATHAVAKAGLAPGETFAVWGLGPVGLAVVLAATLTGASAVAGFDLNPGRVAEARALGIPAFDPRETAPADVLPPRSVDALFDAAGAGAVVLEQARALVHRGPVVLIGNLPGRVDADLMPLIMAEQRILGVRSYSAPAWDRAVRTVASTPFHRTLGDEVPLGPVALERFELAASGAGRPFAVVPHPV
ncbi:zinc-dependent alcohol dehydrogenase [Jiangella mangrovi]|uniref:Threonine dehydrogenase-like Zn-dependent dehydrogenase n=1 Tax=Jiangella mangrovi TaxID=1524084 RepID=A0A7W9GU86_9ACTN|nr:alcohol dehydrogenase catalytic domain-containing protein [Jiangella mangrovi]MBB5790114.1 threonine dehydrogenase-like Zn-dependent dehydrogenase [Jiangella mangrovi]